VRRARRDRLAAALLALVCALSAQQALALPVAVSGELAVREELRDPQFGMAARAPGLRRIVAMWQWQEQRDAQGARSYAPAWSEQPIDSRAFAGNGTYANPALPFTSAQWWSATATLGGDPVAPELLATVDDWQALPVDASSLPENLAAVFRVDGDVLFSGEDAQHPQIGDLRVRWQVLPPGPVHGAAERDGSTLRAGAGAALTRGIPSGGELPGLAQGARPGSDLLLWLQAAAALGVLVLLLVLWGRRRSRRRR